MLTRADSLTLTNARVIDPEADRIFRGGLVIADGLIREVFEGDRPGEDCGGKHLAPGIIDMTPTNSTTLKQSARLATKPNLR